MRADGWSSRRAHTQLDPSVNGRLGTHACTGKALHKTNPEEVENWDVLEGRMHPPSKHPPSKHRKEIEGHAKLEAFEVPKRPPTFGWGGHIF